MRVLVCSWLYLPFSYHVRILHKEWTGEPDKLRLLGPQTNKHLRDTFHAPNQPKVGKPCRFLSS